MASYITADLNQITPDQWLSALREWERGEFEAELYGEPTDTGLTRLYILKETSGISLVTAQPNHKNESLEKLSTVECIELTEKFLSNFVLAHEYEDIGRIWKCMAKIISDANEQISRINLIIKEAEEMATTLHLSLQTALNDQARDFLTSLTQAPTIPSPSPKAVESSEEDLYGGNVPEEEPSDNNYWLDKNVVVLSSTQEESSEEDLYAPTSHPF